MQCHLAQTELGSVQREDAPAAGAEGGGQGAADHAGLGVLGAAVERLQRDIDPRVIAQVGAGRDGERAGVTGSQVTQRDHADPVPGQQPDLVEAGPPGRVQGDDDHLLARGGPHHGGARGIPPLRELRQRAQLDLRHDAGSRGPGELHDSRHAADPDDQPRSQPGQPGRQPPARPASGLPAGRGAGSLDGARRGPPVAVAGAGGLALGNRRRSRRPVPAGTGCPRPVTGPRGRRRPRRLSGPTPRAAAVSRSSPGACDGPGRRSR